MIVKSFIVVCLLLAASTLATDGVPVPVGQCNNPSTCFLGWNGPNPLNLDFGDLLKYNIFTSGNFNNSESNPSDVEGRVAVGGNHQVPLGHSIGDKLCPALSSISDHPDVNGATCNNLGQKCCAGYDSNNLVVRGSSVWTGGRLYWGGGCVGDLNASQLGHFVSETGTGSCPFGECIVTEGLTPECSIDTACVPANPWWTNQVNKLRAASTALYNLPTNGATFWQGVATPASASPHLDYSGSPWVWTNHLWLQPLGNQNLNVFEVDASVLQQATSFYWAPDPACTLGSDLNVCAFFNKPNPNSFIVINVKATAGQDCQISNVNVDALKPYTNNVIWNFGQCQNKLKIQGDDGTGMSMHGMILAPDADLYSRGMLNGQVYVRSFTGTAQINWWHFNCANQTVCVEDCTNLFGCASAYNVFVAQNYYGTSDVQGRLAAGGDVSFLSGFSVGDQLFPNATETFKLADWNALCRRQLGTWNKCDLCDKCGQAVIVGGRSITSAEHGRIYFGNWLSPDLSKLDLSKYSSPEYGTVSYYGAELLNGTTCPGLANHLGESFAKAFAHLKALSAKFCRLPATGSVLAPQPEDGDTLAFLRINLFGNKKQEVVYIDGSQLLHAHTFEISQWAEGATIVFNVRGEVSGFNNIDLSALSRVPCKIVWNFCDAKTLYISGVAVWGTILAPYADVQGGPGVHHGHLFANSFNGTTQSNWVPYCGCTQVCEPPKKNCTTHQCVVNDACPVHDCKHADSKSFWFGPADRCGLSPNFRCNHPKNPRTAIKCTWEETDDCETNKHAKFFGTVCNDKDEKYCLDFNFEFTKYHGPKELSDGTWDGRDEKGRKSPKFDMCWDKCRGKCYGDQQSCKNPFDHDECRCAKNGEGWDYYERALGTFAGHPGSPWEGIKGRCYHAGPSTQRGWGANQFNLQYGLSTDIVCIIEKGPTNKKKLGDLKLNFGYASSFNWNLDQCDHLKPLCQQGSENNETQCHSSCGVGALTVFGTCVDAKLPKRDDIPKRCSKHIFDNYKGKCLCRPGYTGSHAFAWNDPETGKVYVLADVCDRKCTGDRKEVCVPEEKPDLDDGDCLRTTCDIERVKTGNNQNPGPRCGVEEYKFIGTVEICSPHGIDVSPKWSTYFFVDKGIVVSQLWGDQIGDWEQVSNKVIVHGAKWKQDCPPRCFKLYFKASKPNPHLLKCKDDYPEQKAPKKEANKKKPVEDGGHCAFLIDSKDKKDNVIHIDFGTHKRQFSNASQCIEISNTGCFNTTLTTLQGPGVNCGTGANPTLGTCPVCPESNISSLVSDNGQEVSTRLAQLEDSLNVPRGTFMIYSADNTNGVISVELTVNPNVANINDVIAKLNSAGYAYSVGLCPPALSPATSLSYSLFLLVALLAFANLF